MRYLSGKLSAFGFESLCRGDSRTFKSGVSISGSLFSVPAISVGVTDVITEARFGCVDTGRCST